jgi:hypothetical protein
VREVIKRMEGWNNGRMGKPTIPKFHYSIIADFKEKKWK